MVNQNVTIVFSDLKLADVFSNQVKLIASAYDVEVPFLTCGGVTETFAGDELAGCVVRSKRNRRQFDVQYNSEDWEDMPWVRSPKEIGWSLSILNNYLAMAIEIDSLCSIDGLYQHDIDFCDGLDNTERDPSISNADQEIVYFKKRKEDAKCRWVYCAGCYDDDDSSADEESWYDEDLAVRMHKELTEAAAFRRVLYPTNMDIKLGDKVSKHLIYDVKLNIEEID